MCENFMHTSRLPHFRKKSEELVDPVLVIQVWDNNKFRKDKHIGQYNLNLLGFEGSFL